MKIQKLYEFFSSTTATVLLGCCLLLLTFLLWLLFYRNPMPKNLPMEKQVDSQHRYAILIGINDYDSNIGSLEYGEADVVDLRSTLLEGGYAQKNIHLLLGPAATKKNIEETIDSVLRKITTETRGKQAVLFIAFAGHGFDKNLCPVDINLDRLRTTSYSLSSLLNQLNSPRLVNLSSFLFIDACRTKSTNSVKLTDFSFSNPQQEMSNNMAICFACKSGEQAQESPHLGHGLFFHHVIYGMSHFNEETIEGCGVSLDKLASYLFNKVPNEVVTNRAGTTQGENNNSQQPQATLLTARDVFVVQFGDGLVLDFLPENQRRVAVDLIMLPAVNEGWWGDEMPWFLPCFRLALLRELIKKENASLDKIQTYQKILSEDSSEELQKFLAKELASNCFLTDEDKELFNDMQQWCKSFDNGNDSHNRTLLEDATEKYEKRYEELVKEAETGDFPVRIPQFPPRKAIMAHMLGVLYTLLHIETCRYHGNDCNYSLKAADYFSQARLAYAVPNCRDCLAVRSFDRLCESDSLRLGLLQDEKPVSTTLEKFKNFVDRIQGWEKGEHPQKSDRISYAFRVELLTTYAKKSAERGGFVDKYFIYADAVAERFLENSPVHASCLEARAWALVDNWRLKEALVLFEKAKDIRTKIADKSKNKNDPIAKLYVNYAEHAIATCGRYEVLNSVNDIPHKGFEMIAKEAEALRTEDTKQSFPYSQYRLASRLPSRIAGSYARAADVLLFDHTLKDEQLDKRLQTAKEWYQKAIKLVKDKPIEKTFYEYHQGKFNIVQTLLEEEYKNEQSDMESENAPNQYKKTNRANVAAKLIASCKVNPCDENLNKIRIFLDARLTNPYESQLFQRDNTDLNWLMAEFLLTQDSNKTKQSDLFYWTMLLSQFQNNKDIKDYLKRRCDFGMGILDNSQDEIMLKYKMFYEGMTK